MSLIWFFNSSPYFTNLERFDAFGLAADPFDNWGSYTLVSPNGAGAFGRPVDPSALFGAAFAPILSRLTNLMAIGPVGLCLSTPLHTAPCACPSDRF